MPQFRGEITSATIFEFEADSKEHAEALVAKMGEDAYRVTLGNGIIQASHAETHVHRTRARRLRKVWAFVSDWEGDRRIIKPVADHPVDIQDAVIGYTFVISMDAADAETLAEAQAKVELEYERKGAMTAGGVRK